MSNFKCPSNLIFIRNKDIKNHCVRMELRIMKEGIDNPYSELTAIELLNMVCPTKIPPIVSVSITETVKNGHPVIIYSYMHDIVA